jgi:uncharacterized membrane protein YbhN (UPF0104 family)
MATVSTATRSIVRRLRDAVASRRFRAWARPIAGLSVLAAVVWRFGATPFVDGLLGIDARAVAAAFGLCAVSTAATAWRWQVVAGRLGVRVAFPRAFAMYYRSQFLNTVLPGGVLGDVHRAVAHGGDSGDLAQASRAVAIERIAGQLVQALVAVVVLAWAGPAFTGWTLLIPGIGLVLLVTGAVVAVFSVRTRRVVARELGELRVGVGSPAAALKVTAASVIALACQVAVFAIAVAAVGERVAPLTTVALALVVLLGASIPVNVGGWGPREGIAGWVFATAGLGSAAGVAASTMFGVLAMIAVTPGAIVALAMRHAAGGDARVTVPVLPAHSGTRGGRTT